MSFRLFGCINCMAAACHPTPALHQRTKLHSQGYGLEKCLAHPNLRRWHHLENAVVAKNEFLFFAPQLIEAFYSWQKIILRTWDPNPARHIAQIKKATGISGVYAHASVTLDALFETI